jgi:hypothetical protein
MAPCTYNPDSQILCQSITSSEERQARRSVAPVDHFHPYHVKKTLGNDPRRLSTFPAPRPQESYKGMELSLLESIIASIPWGIYRIRSDGFVSDPEEVGEKGEDALTSSMGVITSQRLTGPSRPFHLLPRVARPFEEVTPVTGVNFSPRPLRQALVVSRTHWSVKCIRKDPSDEGNAWRQLTWNR